MSAPNVITVAGNLTADPETRRTSSEIPFTRLRIAVSRRIFNAATDTWEDRQDGYFSVTCWRDTARHVGQSLTKGDRVIITGRLTRRQFEVQGPTGDTETRHVVEIEAEEIGASLRWSPWAKMSQRPLAEPQHVAAGRSTDAPDGRGNGLGDGLADGEHELGDELDDDLREGDVTAAA